MEATSFYLGRLVDAQGKPTDKPLLYDPADLTTHGIVTGMTGSGKTGLCIGLLEEAALQGIPAIIVDPKGDLTNLLLHFPNLAPRDFAPWLDAEAVRRQGKTIDQAAEETAAMWKKGLTEWGIEPVRIQKLAESVQFAIYTPGSEAGLPVSVLSSLEVPPIPWEGNREILRERISSTVTAILGLVGMDNIDPLHSREHILLANIFENAWSRGRSLDLTELILQTQNPPFEKLGAFPVENFFPEKDRNQLAMLLNNILASPGFETWREGQPLDISALLYAADGRPRHSVFYLAHLPETERMFFVTLLFSAIETWMRTQAGSTSLRAILYMDEIFGYLPPLANPPSKTILLRMLKQARAFGVGILLATQNPVDVDYKGLSNAGTWIIGKLQTDQDKQRLLDGLEGASGGTLNRRTLDSMISALGKRVFVMHNVHEKQPVAFQTRWVMNYLAGPLTRSQIPALNRLVGAALPISRPEAASQAAARPEVQPEPPPGFAPIPAGESTRSAPSAVSQTRPPVPSGIAEYFLPMNLSLSEAFAAAGKPVPADARQKEVVYRPALLAAAQIRYFERKYGVDSEIVRAALVTSPDRRGVVRWENFPYQGPSLEKIETIPAPVQARFAALEPPLNDAKTMAALQRDFADWLYRTESIKVRANEILKVYAGPDVSQAEFMKACAETAREARDAEVAKVTAQYDRQLKTLQDKLEREERELQMDQEELSQRKLEEIGTHAENVIGLFTGSRRRVSTSLTRRRLTSQAKADVDESVQAIAQYKREIAQLEQLRQQAADEVNQRWGDVVNKISEITLTPKKTDIYVHLFGVAWAPYYLIEAGGQMLELPAFGE